MNWQHCHVSYLSNNSVFIDIQTQLNADVDTEETLQCLITRTLLCPFQSNGKHHDVNLTHKIISKNYE